MRKLVPVILIFILVGVLYFFQGRSPTASTQSESVKINTSVYNTKKTASTDSEKQGNPVSYDQTNAPILNADSAKHQLSSWVLTESKNLNQIRIDTKQKDLELKNKVENFSDADKTILTELALDISKTVNERILASYMLKLDQTKSSEENLLKLGQKALPDFGPVTAHSEAEIRRGQELAVRYMAVDELAERASHSVEALGALKKLATEAESAEIRGYAQRKLKELK